MNPDEGWQVIKPHRVRHCAPSAAPRPAASRSYSPRYLVIMEGKCLNCFSSSHRRADCCLHTHCFNFHGFWHHLSDCKCPRKSSRALEVPEAVSQVPRGTLSSLGDGGTTGAPTPSIASRFSEPDLILPIVSVCFIPRSWDPVVEEATLGTTITAPGHSCQEEIAIMVAQLDNPPPIAMSPCSSKPLPPVDIQTPEIFRSEEEKLVGQELIEALSKFKLSKVPPLSPSSRYESSSSFEAIIVHSKENQSSY
jgi:hypothetical protein